MGVKAHYLHSEIDTLERIEILRDLRQGVYDVGRGHQLAARGLDLPEVSLVCILDADKEGYLQVGRLADPDDRPRRTPPQRPRDSCTPTRSQTRCARRSRRRSAVAPSKSPTNAEHGIEPIGIRKEIRDITDRLRVAEDEPRYAVDASEMPRDELLRMIKEFEAQMKVAARELEFERAAQLRDQLVELRREMVGDTLRACASSDRPARPRRQSRGRRRGP